MNEKKIVQHFPLYATVFHRNIRRVGEYGAHISPVCWFAFVMINNRKLIGTFSQMDEASSSQLNVHIVQWALVRLWFERINRVLRNTINMDNVYVDELEIATASHRNGKKNKLINFRTIIIIKMYWTNQAALTPYIHTQQPNA